MGSAQSTTKTSRFNGKCYTTPGVKQSNVSLNGLICLPLVLAVLSSIVVAAQENRKWFILILIILCIINIIRKVNYVRSATDGTEGPCPDDKNYIDYGNYTNVFMYA